MRRQARAWSRRSRRPETTPASPSSGTSAACSGGSRAQSGEAERAWRRAADEALQAGDERMLADAVGWEASSMALGPTPVDAAIVRCKEIRAILSRRSLGGGARTAAAGEPARDARRVCDRLRAARRVARPRWRGSARRWTRRSRTRRSSSPCWRATSAAPSALRQGRRAYWSGWESGRCSRRPRATSRRCCCWRDATRSGPACAAVRCPRDGRRCLATGHLASGAGPCARPAG